MKNTVYSEARELVTTSGTFKLLRIRAVVEKEHRFVMQLSLQHVPTGRYYLHQVGVYRRSMHAVNAELTYGEWFILYENDIRESLLWLKT
jgi:hypothetical protein